MNPTVWLILPDDQELLRAAGRVALAHGQLEVALRYMVKTLAGVTTTEALDSTERETASELRRQIKRLTRQKIRDETAKVKISALLGRAEKLSLERNKLIHRPFGVTPEGSNVAKDENHEWGPAPNPDVLNALADRIVSLHNEMNEARLNGFIAEALVRSPADN